MTSVERQELRKTLLTGTKEDYKKLKENLTVHYGADEVSREEYIVITQMLQEPDYYGPEQ